MINEIQMLLLMLLAGILIGIMIGMYLEFLMIKGKFHTSMNRKVCYDTGYKQGRKDAIEEFKSKIVLCKTCGKRLPRNQVASFCSLECSRNHKLKELQ